MKNKVFQFFILAVIFIFIAKGEQAILYAKDAMQICYNMIIPTLFPFFICSGLLIYSGFCESMSKIFEPLMMPLFNINPNGSTAFVLGIISGYPLGAVTVCQLYEGLYISKSEAERLLGFCNNSGPLFILGSVGIGLYSGLKTGIMIYAVHILSALLVGIIMRFYKRQAFIAPKTQITVRNNVASGFGEVLENSIKSILNVCGAVIFFSVISRLCLDFVSIKGAYSSLVYGICEFASGVVKISEADIDFTSKMVLSAFIVGFAGISVHIQVLAVVSRYELSMKPYIAGKLMHGIISAVLMFCVLKINQKPQIPGIVSISGGFAVNSLYMLLFVVTIFVLGMILRKVSGKRATKLKKIKL